MLSYDDPSTVGEGYKAREMRVERRAAISTAIGGWGSGSVAKISYSTLAGN